MAWNELEKNLPDCLVIDIIMPNNEGYTFIKNLKMHGKKKIYKILILGDSG